MLDRPVFVIGIPDSIALDLIVLLCQHSQCGPLVTEQRAVRHDRDNPESTRHDPAKDPEPDKVLCLELWREVLRRNERARNAFRRRMRIPDILWGGDPKNRQYITNILIQHAPSIQGFFEKRLICNPPPIPDAAAYGAYARTELDLSPIWQIIQSPATCAVVVIDHDKKEDPFVVEAMKRGAHIVTQRLIEMRPLKAMEKVLDWCGLLKEEYIYHLGGKDQPRTDMAIADAERKEQVEPTTPIDLEDVDNEPEAVQISDYASDDTRKRLKDMTVEERAEVLDLPAAEVPDPAPRELTAEEEATLPRCVTLAEWIEYGNEQGIDIADIEEKVPVFPEHRFISEWKTFCAEQRIDISDFSGRGVVAKVIQRVRETQAEDTSILIARVKERLVEATAIGAE